MLLPNKISYYISFVSFFLQWTQTHKKEDLKPINQRYVSPLTSEKSNFFFFLAECEKSLLSNTLISPNPTLANLK